MNSLNISLLGLAPYWDKIFDATLQPNVTDSSSDFPWFDLNKNPAANISPAPVESKILSFGKELKVLKLSLLKSTAPLLPLVITANLTNFPIFLLRSSIFSWPNNAENSDSFPIKILTYSLINSLKSSLKALTNPESEREKATWILLSFANLTALKIAFLAESELHK